MSALSTYILHLADDALILAQRNGEWCGHGPVLEQDIAITNITLDLVGQARSLYQYAAELKGNGATEDTLTGLREEREFLNCLLVELPRGDWGQTILKQFFFSAYQYLLYEKMSGSANERLAAIAAKSLKEISYHRRWSAEWVIRLGDGTEESRQRMLTAFAEVWPYTGEMFISADYETEAAATGIGPNPASLQEAWLEEVKKVLTEATLLPDDSSPNDTNNYISLTGTYMQRGGKQGIHTEHLGFILTDLQYMQRVYPGCEW